MSLKSLTIEQVSVAALSAPLSSPFRISTGQHDDLTNVFLKLTCSSGVAGFGEAAVATHITGETIPETLANLQKAAHAVEGRAIYDPVVFCSEFRPFFKKNHAALAAFEMAVLDAWARHEEIPFWKLFGARPKPFSTDITIVIGTLDEAVAGVTDFYQRGFRSFKIKIGRNEVEDFLRVQAVAKLAPKATIILDANQAYTASRMFRFLASLQTAGIRPALLEQPVPRGDWDGLTRLTRESGVLVCVDESVKSLSDLQEALRRKAVSAVNIKFMKSGILEARAIAVLARKNGLKIMIGAMMESSLAITAAAHFTAGLGGFDYVDLDTTFFVKGPFSRSPYLDKRGRFDLTGAGPGVGVTVKMPRRK